MTGDVAAPSHPAKWSEPILEAITRVLLVHGTPHAPMKILDPFAGVGLPALAAATPESLGDRVYGVEIEPEWAGVSGATVGSALDLPWADSTFDALVTSPSYGNRMADCHDAKDDSQRVTYRHQLGRMPSEGSSSVMQWGPTYRTFHDRAWAEALRVLRSRALAVVNVSNHIRGGIEQRVVEYQLNSWLRLGATVEEVVKIPTRRMGFGANGDFRVDGERLLVLRAPEKPAGTML